MAKLLTTEFVCCTGGVDKNGNTHSRETLIGLAESFKNKKRDLPLSFNHNNHWLVGTVEALRFAEHPDLDKHPEFNQGALWTRVGPNISAIRATQHEVLYPSIEYYKNTKTGEVEFIGLSLVPIPATDGLKKVVFNSSNEENNKQTLICSAPSEQAQPFNLENLDDMSKQQAKVAATAKENKAAVAESKPVMVMALAKPEEPAKLQKNKAEPAAEPAQPEPEQVQLNATPEQIIELTSKVEKLETILELTKKVNELETGKNTDMAKQNQALESQVLKLHNKKNMNVQDEERVYCSSKQEVVDFLSTQTEEFEGLTKLSAEDGSLTNQAERKIELLMQKEDVLKDINYRLVQGKTGGSLYPTLTGDNIMRKPGVSDFHKQTKGFTSNTFTTQDRMHPIIIPFELIDGWIGQDMLKIYRRYYNQSYFNALVKITFYGLAADNKTTDILKIDKSFSLLLEEYNSGSNVLKEVEPGTGQVIIGKKRTVPIAGITPTDGTSGKIVIALENHGFVIGGKVRIVGDDSHADKEYIIHKTGSTISKIIITSTTKSAFTANAKLVQKPDYPILEKLVDDMESGILEAKEETSLLPGYQLWIGRKTKSHRGGMVNTAIQNKLSDIQVQGLVTNQISGLPLVQKSMFPDDQIWLHQPKNLSICETIGSRRHTFEQDNDNSAYKEIRYAAMKNFIEDPRAMFVAKNISYLEEAI